MGAGPSAVWAGLRDTHADVEREGQNDADREGDRDHVVRRGGPEHLRGERAPGDGICCRTDGPVRLWQHPATRQTGLTIVRLRVLAGPQTRPRNRQERCNTQYRSAKAPARGAAQEHTWPLRINDRQHHDI